ncbi:MAG: hypothetical protein ACFE7E_05890 [Candidatus Hodarchaeota archaeon]
MGTLLDLEKIEETVKGIQKISFTILDFVEVFQKLYPEDWKHLVDRFGQFGEKRRYTVNTYLSNRLDLYSHKQNSLLEPLIHYSEGKFKGRRMTTKEERRHFGSPWIAVYKKKKIK